MEYDHKPFEVIETKPLYITSKRLKSILLQLAQYNIKVIYKLGGNGDTPSRAYLGGHYPDKHSQVNAISHLTMSGQTSRVEG